ncbi:MAG: type IV pilin-like G/H family protein [Scytolyngbya sp. HA4215-MV1]|jgi:hypothetical protein|nr:type IV pilin-like G/H family protein [Scytolyngbya sp. HA4215-MV1]
MATSACSVLTPNSVSTPVQTPTIATSATPAKSPPLPAEDLLRAAEDKAMSAANLTQLAQTQDDWNLAALQWQRAIALLKSIPAKSPQRSIAQKRLSNYERNLALTQRHVKSALTPTAASTISENGVPLMAGPDAISDKANIQTAEAEARNYLKTLNRAQQAFFLEKKEFASNLEDLKLGLPAETQNYTFRIESVSTESVLSVAIAKRGGIKSYSSAVYIIQDVPGNRLAPSSIVCASAQPSIFAPNMPELVEKQLKCPANAVLE